MMPSWLKLQIVLYEIIFNAMLFCSIVWSGESSMAMDC